MNLVETRCLAYPYFSQLNEFMFSNLSFDRIFARINYRQSFDESEFDFNYGSGVAAWS